jgi:hypothetical protein
MSIANVDFGELDAESEKNLAGYFVDTGVLAKLASGLKQFIIGRKGSGKTALFRLATSATLKQPQVVEVEFDQYPWEFHRQLKQSGMMAESAYEASWRFLLLLMMAKEWSEIAEDSVKRKAGELLHTILPNPNRGFWSSLLSRVRNPTKLALPGVTVAGQASVSLGSIDIGKEDATYAINVMSTHLGALADLASIAYPGQAVVIKVDRLDDGWDATPESKGLIIGELKAARALNQQLHHAGMPAPVITFLRSDIYQAVQFNDKNKMATSIERLEWTDERLMDVLVRRIAASLHIDPKDAWKAAFSESEMRQRARPQSYFIRRTMGRPRDVIAFAIHCRDVAVENQRSIVETADIYDAENRYSQHLLAELSDELHKQLPALATLLDTLRGLGRMSFMVADWIEAARRRSPEISETDAKAQLGTLYDASVVGVARVGGSKGGSQQVFTFTAAAPKPDFSGRIYVHPGLKKGLQLKEGQAADDGEESEPDAG